ncbi:MAG: class I SAM-dependent methyltransferase [Balneolaceae bacterium]|nr:class I SAM-dependent methyltransferase [Balneolaceae bacterium]
MGIKRFLAKQARKPSGLFGRLFAGKVFNKANSSLEDMAFEMIPVNEENHILEIGFGNGRLISKIGNAVNPGKICGIDISETMVKQAAKKNKELVERGVVELKKASVEHIPYADNFFDHVITLNTIYFWPNPAENIREIHRVLKHEGLFLCGIRPEAQMKEMKLIKHNPEIFKHLYTEDSLKKFLSEAGFKHVSATYQQAKPYDNLVVTGKKSNESF